MARDEFEVFKEQCFDRLMVLDAPGAMLRVALCLLRHGNRTEFQECGETTVWPSLTKLASHANLTRESVCRALRWLKQAGFYRDEAMGRRAIGLDFLDPLPSGIRTDTPPSIPDDTTQYPTRH